MILLSGFLDVAFRALVFVGLALGIGGIVFRYFVLKPSHAEEQSSRRTATLIAVGALIVAASQLLALLTSVATLASGARGWCIAAFASTTFARAGIVHAALALCLGLVALRLRRGPTSEADWTAAAVLGAMVLVAGAWLTHGASRLELAGALMTVTVVHQLAAAIWVGGTMHLVAQWRLLRGSPGGKQAWPRILARFSPMALGAVGVLVAAGLALSLIYVGDLDGLLGTAYGTMLLTKIALMGAMLLLGGVNNLTIRHWRQFRDPAELRRRLPVFVEVEAGIGVIILMAAAALTGQPPAVDIPTQQATPAEVLHVFAPKWPQFTPPPHAEMLATASSSLDPFALPSTVSKVQSDFNHNVSGALVILVGLGAFLSRATRWRWTRNWPLLFLPLAAFLLIIGEPNGWPLGPEPFWSTLLAPEVLTHRLATLIVAVLGLIVWRVEVGGLAATRWRYVFPLLSWVGGALLLTHSHSVLAVKWAFLIEVSHNAIGIFAVFAGAGAWLEMHLPGRREGRIAGVLWPVFLTLVGVVLLFYRET